MSADLETKEQFGEVIREINAKLPTKSDFSDVMMKRDNYFHSCWLRMKQMHPDVMEQMFDIELYIAGLEPGGEKEEDNDGADSNEGEVL